MESDTDRSLASIREDYQRPLFWKFLEIQKYNHAKKNSNKWIKNLKCLYEIDSRKQFPKVSVHDKTTSAKGKLIGQKYINPLIESNRGFVAVSYTWEASTRTNENSNTGGHSVQSIDGQTSEPADVRDVVLDRVRKYTKYCKIHLFWIDRICINQKNKEERETAIQSMDKVYSLSAYPIGLLSTCINSGDHVDLLIKLLRGELVGDEEAGRLSPHLSTSKAQETLKLLDCLTSDTWWERAWIFQEVYLSSERMVLLVPHHSSLEGRKQNAREVLGSLAGELCINSVKFHNEATKFCIAFKKERRNQQQHYQDLDICNRIQRTARQYKELLPENQIGEKKYTSISPYILVDLGRRKITKCLDILAITANCCRYPLRLNTESLADAQCSQSLSLLTLYLLNGEIIWNGRSNGKRALLKGVVDFVQAQSLHVTNPPVYQKELTFMRRCRLPNVQLLQEGIKTTGRLWQLGKVIDTGRIFNKLPQEGLYSGNLSQYHRRRLMQLINALKSGYWGRKYRALAQDIQQYLQQDISLGNDMFSKMDTARSDKDMMIRRLVQAMEQGKILRLACLVDTRPKYQGKPSCKPYCGIFITDLDPLPGSRGQSFVFTACDYSKDNKSFVSLEVSWNGLTYRDRPQLTTKKWVNGLCFVDKYPKMDVVFQWPPSLAM